MRGRLALAAMLAGSLTFLVSLYFGWIHAVFCIPRSVCIASHNPSLATNGWNDFGQIAALLAIALATGAVAAMVDQELAKRLPIGWVAVALGIFVLPSVSELWTSAIAEGAFTKYAVGLAPGAYVGLAGVAVACAGAAAARRGGITGPLRVTAVAGQLVTLTMIASIVLPALNASASSYEMSEFQGSPATFICVFACLSLIAWQGRRPGPRLATAAAIGTLVAGELLPIRHDYAGWPYEFWLLLACSAGLLLLGLVGSRGMRLRRLSVSELAIVAGSVLLLVSLFLPWQSFCEVLCSSQRGWSTTAVAGAFALGLLVALVWTGRFVRELAIGAAIFVFTAGLATALNVAALRLGFEYGALLGFVGAALLLAFGVGRSRPILNKRVLVRLVPVLAALALLSFEVAPNVATYGDVLSNSKLFAIQSPFLQLDSLGAAAILLTVRLLLRWFDRRRDTEVVLLPLALLALTALALIQEATTPTTIGFLGFVYKQGVSWEAWVAVFLCLLLVACGRVERNGGRLKRMHWRQPRDGLGRA